MKFWDDYWADLKLPNIVNVGFSFERCLANVLKEQLSGCQGEVLEIGCAPGKWLHFFAAELGLKPSGIEYSGAGTAATIKNFSLLGVDYVDIFQGDFIKIQPVRQFDVVVSLGFIEHFQDPEEVVRQHLLWLKPGGTLVLGVPNFRGIYQVLQGVLDSTILDKHNLEVMEPAFLNLIADKYALKTIYLDYLGSFEPSLPISSPGIKNLQQAVVKAFLGVAIRLRRHNLFDSYNNSFISSYLLAVYRKGISG